MPFEAAARSPRNGGNVSQLSAPLYQSTCDVTQTQSYLGDPMVTAGGRCYIAPTKRYCEMGWPINTRLTVTLTFKFTSRKSH